MVIVFRAVSFLLVRLPLRISEPVARFGFIAGYYLWPAKRHIIKRNAAHVLGLPVTHPDVAGLARGVYGTYSRFAVEVMRMPGLPADEPVRLMVKEGRAPRPLPGLLPRLPSRGPGRHRGLGPHRQHRGLRRRLRRGGPAHLRPRRRFGIPRALRAAQRLPGALGRDHHPLEATA